MAVGVSAVGKMVALLAGLVPLAMAMPARVAVVVVLARADAVVVLGKVTVMVVAVAVGAILQAVVAIAKVARQQTERQEQSLPASLQGMVALALDWLAAVVAGNAREWWWSSLPPAVAVLAKVAVVVGAIAVGAMLQATFAV